MHKKIILVTEEKSPELSIFCGIASLNNRVNAISHESTLYKALLHEIIEGQNNGEFFDYIKPDTFVENVIYNLSGICISWQLNNGSFDAKEKAIQQIDFLLDMITVK